MASFRNETKVVFYITVAVCSALVAVMAVRMDVRDARNDRMRSLCAVYWEHLMEVLKSRKPWLKRSDGQEFRS